MSTYIIDSEPEIVAVADADEMLIHDIAAGKFLVEGFTNGSGTVASPWSAAVS